MRGALAPRFLTKDKIMETPKRIASFTVDFQTVGDENTPADNCVTVRDRDTMEQVRIPVSELKAYIEKKIEF